MSQDLSVVCRCERELAAPARWAGRRIACPGCGEVHELPPPPGPAEPAWVARRRRFRKRGRWSRRTPGEAATRRDDAAEDRPPDGLRVAVMPPTAEALAARRRKRRRRTIILSVVGVTVSGIGGAVWWAARRYRRWLYRGMTPLPIRSTSDVADLASRHGQVRRSFRQAFAAPGDRDATAAVVDAAGALLADMETAKAFPGRQDLLRNQLAWLKLTTPLPAYRDPAGALALAEQAATGRGAENPAYLDTYAMALLRNGRREEALAAARRAVALEPRWKDLRRTLEIIESADGP